MEKKFKRTTVTSALPYANGPVHIGHLAGVYVPADIYVRYLRLKKEDVIFIGGSDEHGVPITIRAKKEGITPQDVVDRYHTLIKKSFEEFGVSFDVYSRTTSKTHHDTASDFFRKLYDIPPSPNTAAPISQYSGHHRPREYTASLSLNTPPQGASPLDPTKGTSSLWTPIRAIELVTSSCNFRVLSRGFAPDEIILAQKDYFSVTIVTPLSPSP